ncbi:MAG: hypothetical protein RL038_551, partial [Actinomycetota bacterium]
MARRNRRRDEDVPEIRSASSLGMRQVVSVAGEDWVMQPITGSASTKVYRCPGCNQEIRPATPHVVAWPYDDHTNADARVQD